MARQYTGEEVLDLVMDDDPNEVFCLGSDDELGFEDDVDDWLDILKRNTGKLLLSLKIVFLQLMPLLQQMM